MSVYHYRSGPFTTYSENPLEQATWKKMNQVAVIVRNPAYVAEVELDEDRVDPTDLAPLVSGNAPIVTAPASEDGEAAEDVIEDEDDGDVLENILEMLQNVLNNLEDLHKEVKDLRRATPGGAGSQQPPVVPRINVWDTERAWEREYKLHFDSSRDEISNRLFKQVVDLLRIMHERVSQQTWNERDKELIDGLNNIPVMHVRLGKLTECSKIKLRNLICKGIMADH